MMNADACFKLWRSKIWRYVNGFRMFFEIQKLVEGIRKFRLMNPIGEILKSTGVDMDRLYT